jgi:hypothetical protein
VGGTVRRAAVDQSLIDGLISAPAMTDTGLRRADTADLPAIRTVVDAAYSRHTERIARPPAPMTADYEALHDFARIWVVDRGAGVVELLVMQDRGDHLFLETLPSRPKPRAVHTASC